MVRHKSIPKSQPASSARSSMDLAPSQTGNKFPGGITDRFWSFSLAAVVCLAELCAAYSPAVNGKFLATRQLLAVMDAALQLPRSPVASYAGISMIKGHAHKGDCWLSPDMAG